MTLVEKCSIALDICSISSFIIVCWIVFLGGIKQYYSKFQEKNSLELDSGNDGYKEKNKK